MDMVCDKLVDVDIDFTKDPIQTYVDGEWLRAKGTTLGADDGIGCAMQMAVLADNSLEHGPIECVFTRDEETGLTGAHGMKPGFMKGNPAYPFSPVSPALSSHKDPELYQVLPHHQSLL